MQIFIAVVFTLLLIIRGDDMNTTCDKYNRLSINAVNTVFLASLVSL